MFPAARIGDRVTHDTLVPSGLIGEAPAPLAKPVMIEGLPAAYMTCTVVCSGAVSAGVPAHPPPPAPPMILVGAPNVRIGGWPAARWVPSGDVAACGSFLGDPVLILQRTVLIGNGSMPARPTHPVVTGLGEEVDRFAAASPALQALLSKLSLNHWKFVYGPPGGGTHCNKRSRTITIDSNSRGRPIEIAGSLAHESGHALYTGAPDYSSRQKYIDSMLDDEGAATLSNMKVMYDMGANGGPNVGPHGNPSNDPKYEAAYAQYLQDGDGAKAGHEMGSHYGTGENASTPVDGKIVNYETYYGSWYDKAYGPKTP